MKLEAGKSYVTRDGRLVKDLVFNAEAKFPFAGVIGVYWYQWTGSGEFHHKGLEHDTDLVKEYTEPLKVEFECLWGFDRGMHYPLDAGQVKQFLGKKTRVTIEEITE